MRTQRRGQAATPPAWSRAAQSCLPAVVTILLRKQDGFVAACVASLICMVLALGPIVCVWDVCLIWEGWLHLNEEG